MRFQDRERALKEIAEDREIKKMMRTPGVTAAQPEPATSAASAAKASTSASSTTSDSVVCSIQVKND
jgi:hypothetical protein